MTVRAFLPLGIVMALASSVQCRHAAPPMRAESSHDARRATPRMPAEKSRDVPRPTSEPVRPHVLCDIVSMYRWEGRTVLHVQCPPGVAPGQAAHVIDCDGQPLLRVEAKVTKISAPYALVDSTLPGTICCCKRRVRIYLTP